MFSHNKPKQCEINNAEAPRTHNVVQDIFNTAIALANEKQYRTHEISNPKQDPKNKTPLNIDNKNTSTPKMRIPKVNHTTPNDDRTYNE